MLNREQEEELPFSRAFNSQALKSISDPLNLALQLGVGCAIDLAHAPRPEGCRDLVGCPTRAPGLIAGTGYLPPTLVAQFWMKISRSGWRSSKRACC